MMCSLVQSLLCEPGLIEKTLDRNRARTVICQAFVFSYIWSVGGNLLDQHREKFETFVADQFGEHQDAQLGFSFLYKVVGVVMIPYLMFFNTVYDF